MQRSHTILAFKPPIPFSPTLYLLPLHPHHCLMLLTVSLHLLASSSPFTPSRLFNGMLGVSEQGALNCYTLFRLIPLTLFASRNLTVIFLPLSGSLDSLLCDLIAPTPGLESFLLIPHASGDIIIVARQGLSFSKLSASSLPSFDPYSDYVGVSISLNNFFALSFLNVYAPPFRFSPRDSRTDCFSPSILTIFRNFSILG